MSTIHTQRIFFAFKVNVAIAVAACFALLLLSSCGSSATSQGHPPPTLSSITVTPPNPSIAPGATQQFQATGNYSDGSTKSLTSSVTWTSSSSGAATIENSGQPSPGLATAVATGSSTISAASGSVTGTTGLSVSNATLSSIFISPASSTISVGGSTQFTANGNFSDGTTQNITATAAWSSSNMSIVSVETTGQSNPGDASGVAAGSATVTATSQGVSQLAAVTVSSSTNTTAMPLMDMTNPSQNYLSFAGGLYENSTDAVPTDHDAAGQTIAATIQPLDANGNPSASGKVVLASIGMSNAADEFGQFKLTALSNQSVNQTTLVIANGAKGGITACYWTVAEGAPPCGADTANQYDRVLSDVLSPLGVTERQVQAVWLKEANGGPGVAGCGSGGSLPCNSLCDPGNAGCSNTATTTEALRYEEQLGDILRAAKSRWPNLKVAFLTSRIYAGYATDDLNPEPYAYEYGFSVKWLVEAQILQVRNGTVDPVAGDLGYSNGTAPWVAWGPYIWAAGDTPRSDGLIWCNGQPSAPCNGEVDYQTDGTHPDSLGQAKVAYGANTPKSVMNLLDFFLQSPYTKAWFASSP
jgi:hypothetical protein